MLMRQQILSMMQSWRHDSLFAEYTSEENPVFNSFRTHHRRRSVDTTERTAVLQEASHSLQRLQVALVGHELELKCVAQLLPYVQRLQTLNASQTPEEQFGQLYYLRKWLFWFPISLLQQHDRRWPTMLTLSHLYATALALEPLFPDLDPSFCAVTALSPLDAVISSADASPTEHGNYATSIEFASLMQFPRRAALSYKSRAMRATDLLMQPDRDLVPSVSPDTLSYTDTGNLSPAFAPSSLYFGNSQPTPTLQSPWLEVPSTHAGFGYNTQGWGTASSPSLPEQSYVQQVEQDYSYITNFRGGFVPSAPIWT